MPTVSQEQLEEFKALKSNITSTIYRYGELNLQKKIIDGELLEVEKQINTLEITRQELSNKLKEQFGMTGSIDLQTGEFIPEKII